MHDMSVFEAISDGVFVVDQASVIVAVNSAGLFQFGMEQDDLVGRAFIDLLAPTNAAGAVQGTDLLAMLAEEPGPGRNLRKRVRARHGDGSTFEAELSIGRDGEKAPELRVIVLRDLSSRERLSEDLSRVSDQLDVLIGTLSDGVIIIDQQGVIRAFNAASQRMFGYSAAEVIGRNISILMGEQDAPHHDSYIKRYLAGGEPKIIGVGRVVHGRRRNGETFALQLAVGETSAGDQSEFIGILRDITSKLEAERRLSDLQGQLEYLGRLGAMSEMGAAVAHELNQPLTAMIAYIASAERIARDVIPPNALELCRKASQEAQRAADIVRRLRLMADHKAAEETPVDMSEIVSEAVELVAMANSKKTAKFDWTPAEAGTCMVYGDRVLLGQVIINIVKNALDAVETHEGGRIAIRLAAHGDSVVAVIEDNGPGLADDILTQMFKAFVTTKPHGLGIGLSLARNIVERAGGALRADNDSALGGARFILSLPALGAYDGE